jgi:hypothetical protein
MGIETRQSQIKYVSSKKKICTASICCNLGGAMPVSFIPPGGNSASGQDFGGAGAKANFQQQ